LPQLTLGCVYQPPQNPIPISSGAPFLRSLFTPPSPSVFGNH
jgi:hypothetical protein